MGYRPPFWVLLLSYSSFSSARSDASICPTQGKTTRAQTSPLAVILTEKHHQIDRISAHYPSKRALLPCFRLRTLMMSDIGTIPPWFHPILSPTKNSSCRKRHFLRARGHPNPKRTHSFRLSQFQCTSPQTAIVLQGLLMAPMPCPRFCHMPMRMLTPTRPPYIPSPLATSGSHLTRL